MINTKVKWNEQKVMSHYANKNVEALSQKLKGMLRIELVWLIRPSTIAFSDLTLIIITARNKSSQM